MMKWRGWVTILLMAAACGTKRVDICNADSDCTNIAYPFCDLNGEYSASEGETNVCTIVPPDCSIERCGCSPGATTCDQNQLVVCNTDGMSTTATRCALGCADAKDHCLTFEPSNGLGTPLAGASVQPDVTIPDGSYINTDDGTISGPNGTIIVESLIVSQPSGDIRVFVANTFTISNVKIVGSKVVAFVAAGDVVISGLVDASADAATPGPGQSTSTAVGDCHGIFVGTTATDSGAGGGAGNATSGGSGVFRTTSGGSQPLAPGGMQAAAFSGLIGGCGGGGAGSNSRGGGAGGGGVQIVSQTTIRFDATGILDVGGGGGPAPSDGGGAGGNIILESPELDVEGAITANGGAGAGCSTPGQDGQPTANPSTPGRCGSVVDPIGGGRGGTATNLPGSAHFGVSTLTTGSFGGGGSVGQLLLRTRDGTFAQGGTAIVSALVATATLAIH